MTKSATSHLLPVFARVDLGFERGEGAWLIATNGERYLDFTSGVAVNALGHAHPYLVAALQEQATKLWHMSNLFKSPDGERLAGYHESQLDSLKYRMFSPAPIYPAFEIARITGALADSLAALGPSDPFLRIV